jgi:hypothetical protein
VPPSPVPDGSPREFFELGNFVDVTRQRRGHCGLAGPGAHGRPVRRGEERRGLLRPRRRNVAAIGWSDDPLPARLGPGFGALGACPATTQEIVIVGDPQEAATQALLETAHKRYLPNKVLVVARPTRATSTHAQRQPPAACAG